MNVNNVPCDPSKFKNETLFRLAKVTFIPPAKGSGTKEMNNGAKRAYAIKRLQSVGGDTSRLMPVDVDPPSPYNGREVIRQKSGKIMRTLKKRNQLTDRQRKATEGAKAVRRENENERRMIAGISVV